METLRVLQKEISSQGTGKLCQILTLAPSRKYQKNKTFPESNERTN